MYSAELNVPQNHVYLFKPHAAAKAARGARTAEGQTAIMV